MIILGLDPSLVIGAGLVALNAEDRRVLLFETWSSSNLHEGYIATAAIAKKVSIAISRISVSMRVRLAVEKPFFKQWVGKFDSVGAAVKIARKGSVTIRGKGGLTSEYLNRCIGIFAAHFPVVIDYPPGDWRSQAEIDQSKGQDRKLNGMMRAVEFIESTNKNNPVADLLIAAIMQGNDHLGEAACIAYVDAKISNFVNRNSKFVGGKRDRKTKNPS